MIKSSKVTFIEPELTFQGLSPDLEEGMRIVIPINKWDGLEEEESK